MKLKNHRQKKKKYIEKGTVTNTAWIAGMLTLPFFLLLMILCKELSFRLLMVVFVLLSCYLILTINWKIDYDSNGFTYRNIFRKSVHYRYSEITRIRKNITSTIYIGKKKIHIESSFSGDKNFLAVAVSHAKQAKLTTPEREKAFNGNVKNPEEFILFSVAMPVLTIGAMIFCVVMLRPVPLENLQHSEMKFSNCSLEYDENDNPRLIFTDESGQNYFLHENSHQKINLSDLQQEVNNGQLFTVDYEKVNFVIHQISSEKQIYLSLENFQAEETDTVSGIIICFSVMLVIELLFIAVQNHILRHADRYPNAVKFFVKSSYLVKK